MCDNQLLVERRTGKPVEVKPGKHRLLYNSTELLAGIEMSGVINYAAALGSPTPTASLVGTC
jgi:hypothetical protein